jgi:predicted RNA-binding protein with PUA-like domain
MAAKQCWLMKTEPESFSINDLRQKGIEPWDGVRNYQSRNFMRDDMRVGDLVLIYHSSCDPVGVAGTGRVCRTGYPDETAWNPNDHHFDPKSSPDSPIWYRVDVEFVEKFPRVVTLEEMKAEPLLAGMMVTRRGMRLSIQPVSPDHFEVVRKMGKKKAPHKPPPA